MLEGCLLVKWGVGSSARYLLLSGIPQGWRKILCLPALLLRRAGLQQWSEVSSYWKMLSV